MYSRDTLVLLQHYLDRGLSKTGIAKQLGISRRLVYHLIKSGQFDRDLSVDATPRVRVVSPPKLDAFIPLITERLAQFPALSGVRLLAECRAAGYAGGYSQLTAYLLRVRPRPEPEPLVRFETDPGEQAQFDFATFRFPWGTRYAVLVVLGYSRLLFVEFVPRQTALAVMQSLEHAFAAFDGVPREVLFDQLRAVIVADHRGQGGRLLENAEFARFATHWGFRIRACRAYRAQTKGKVERPVHYLRDNFVYGRTFLGDADLAAQCTQWLDTVANVRVHGTTKELPVVRWVRDEQSVLQPLAARPYRSLVLTTPAVTHVATRTRLPEVVVEQRGLAAYATYAETPYAEVP